MCCIAASLLFSLIGATVSGDILQKYQISDPFGYESSFLYKGGTLTISCTASEKTKSVQVFNQTDQKVVLGEPKSYNELILNLDYFYVGHVYGCEPSMKGVVGSFEIPEFQCDPFSMKAPVICEGTERCVVGNDGIAKCKSIGSSDCFLAELIDIKRFFMESLPKLRNACVDLDNRINNNLTVYGLCHAETIKHGQIIGLAETMDHCNRAIFVDFKFNNKTIVNNELLFETNDEPTSWRLGFDAYSDSQCTVLSADRKIIAEFKSNKLGEVKPLNTSSLKRYDKPYKLMLYCTSTNQGKLRSTATYIVLFDPNPTLYSAVIQNKTISKNNIVEVNCVCETPPGFICQRSWTKPDPSVNPMSAIPNLAPISISTKDLTSHNVSCFWQVWMYKHPVDNGLEKIPLEHEFSTSTIFKHVDIKSSSKAPTTQSNAYTTRDGKSITVTSVDSNTRHAAESSSQTAHRGKGTTAMIDDSLKKKTNESSSKTVIIIVMVGLIVLTVCFVILSLVCWYKKKKNRSPVLTTLDPASVNIISTKETFIRELKNDAAHNVKLITFQMLISSSEQFNEKVQQKIKANIEDKVALKSVLNEYDDFKRIDDEFELLVSKRKLLKCEDVGFLPTCRFNKQELFKSTWLFSGSKDAQLVDSKKDTRDDTRFIAKIPITSAAKSAKVTTTHCSWVTDINNKKAYLLCQAPLESEMVVFLDILIQQKIGLVITLIANEPPDTSKEIKRYYPYYKLNQGEEKVYGNRKLKCLQLISVGDLYETRRCSITSVIHNAAQDTFLISILSYRRWGDFKGVEDSNHLLSIYSSRIRLLNLEGAASKLTLIHCVGGIGRSGTLVACINALDYVQQEGCPVNVFGIADKVRKQRIGAIQGLQQYILVYYAIGQFLNKEFANAAPRPDRSVATFKSKQTKSQKTEKFCPEMKESLKRSLKA